MEPRKINTLLHDDIVYQILQWLPVISLLRFKLVCRTWRALIESSYFIKQHLHLHHYDPNLKDKNHKLIFLLQSNNAAITILLTSMESLKVPNVCPQLTSSDLHGYSPVEVLDIVSYNGIVCLNLLNYMRKHSICLWNPATKQSRVLPQLPFLDKALTMVGFGFDVKNNDYKVVNLIRRFYPDEKRAEVYSLNASSWRSSTTGFRSTSLFVNPRMPFNNGTCFFWVGRSSFENGGIVCFDFSSEMFRTISLPCAYYSLRHTSVVRDEIACIFRINNHKTEIWVFNGYGTVSESWTKLYMIDACSTIGTGIRIELLSMNGNYIFFRKGQRMCRFNVVTKEMNRFRVKNCSLLSQYMYSSFDEALVEFKESLVLV